MKLGITIQDIPHLHRHLVGFARQQHPQVLNRRTAAAVIEIDEERTIAPQYIARVAITMKADSLVVTSALE